MPTTTPASIPDLPRDIQHILNLYFQTQHLIICTKCTHSGTLVYIANTAAIPKNPVFECTKCKDRPVFDDISVEVQLLAEKQAANTAVTQQVQQQQKNKKQPKKRTRVASDASNASKNGEPISTPVRGSASHDDSEMATLRELVKSLQDRLTKMEKENLEIKNQLSMYANKNAALEKQLLVQQKDAKIAQLQTTNNNNNNSDDAIMVDDAEFPALSGIGASKYAHAFDAEKHIAERNIQPLNYKKIITKKSKTTQKPTNKKIISTAIRAFTPPSTEQQGFSYVYYPSKARISRKTQRNNLKALGVTNGRVLDIHYPARNVVALLVHNDYRQQLIDTLKKSKVEALKSYSPLDPSNLVDPVYNNKTIAEKTQIAAEKHNQRLVRALPFIREHISKAVASFFLKEQLISDAQHQSFLDSLKNKNTQKITNPSSLPSTQVSNSSDSQSFNNSDSTTPTTSSPPTTTTNMDETL